MWIMLTWVLSLTIQDKHFASINQIILRWKVTKIMFNFHTLKCVRRVGGGSNPKLRFRLYLPLNFYFKHHPSHLSLPRFRGGGNLDFIPSLNLVSLLEVAAWQII